MLDLFEFKGNEIRFVNAKPVANDVATILGYSDPASTVSKKVKPKYKGVAKMETPGGIQSVTVLEEGGIYQLVLGSKLPIADEFQDWLFEEVLPTIRKTGSYSVQQVAQPQLPQRDAIAYIEATDKLNKMDDGILTRLLRDALVDELALKQNLRALPSEPKQEITIVKVRAKELGYSEKQIGSGSTLGRFVAKKVKHLFFERIGVHNVKHYEVNDELDSAIHAYFLTRTL